MQRDAPERADTPPGGSPDPGPPGAGVDPAAAMAGAVERAVAALDLDALQRQYREQGAFLFVPRFLDPAALSPLLGEAARLEPAMHRSYIPGHKKSGSVSAFAIADGAPALASVYRAPALRAFLARLTGADLKLCPPEDPHACALYFYTEAGDHIGYHYDTSYYRGARYTALLGLVQDSSSRLLCRLHTRSAGRRPPVELAITTEPGSLVFFDGDTVEHAVSPSGPGERRVIFTMEYVTSLEMGRVQRVFSQLKDAFAYFGVSVLWRGRRRSRGAAPAARSRPESG